MNKQARNHLIVLLQGMEENAMSQEQARELSALLESSKEARQLYIDYQFQAMSLDLYAHMSELSPQNIAKGNWPGWIDTESSGTADALAELARLHDEGLKQPIDIALHNKKRAQHAHAGQARPLRLKTRLIVTGSLAAMIAIAGLTVLIVNLFTAPKQEVAKQPSEAIVVATLTDATDAAWENESGQAIELPIDSPIARGQHITLTQGLAEITTNQGAIAVLEAPATIELIDSPNAMRLHAGKLVGICETPRSKGFLVRTPHLDVTDLGTRFGVNASDEDATQVYVIDGEVEVTASTSDGTPTPYTAGESVSINHAGQTQPLEEPLTFIHKMPLSDRDTLGELGAVAYFPMGPTGHAGRQMLASSGWSASARTREHGIQARPAPGQTVQHSAYTFALWLKPGRTAGERHLISLTNEEGPLKRFSSQLSLASDGRVRHYLYCIDPADQLEESRVNGVGLMQYSRSKLPTDQWTHVVVTASGNGQMKLYFNGQRQAKPIAVPLGLTVGTHYALGGAAQTRTDPPEIGRVDLMAYRGLIESLAIFDRQLTDQEVRSLHKTAKQARQTTATTNTDQ